MIVSKLLAKKLVERINKISKTTNDIMQSGNLDLRVETTQASDEVSVLALTFNKMIESLSISQVELIAAEKSRGMAQLATQVAHDIRSPLLVLTRILNDLSSLPEKKRIDARNAVQRVTDIANNLLAEYKQEKAPTETETILSAEPVAMMLESIISEKRIEATDRNIHIILQILPEAYNAFVEVDIAGFKRVLSNLMNNAIEAVKDKDGLITIMLQKVDDKIQIKVKDNGCGIPQDKLFEVLKEGTSFGKTQGSGLGLPYAINKITEWHGDYALASEVNEGTQFEIILPEAKPAAWFRNEILIAEKGRIVVLDDDDYIHHIWQERFSEAFLNKHQLQLIHFNKPADLIQFCQSNQPLNTTTFLLDYELKNYQETGIELAKVCHIGQYASLVTSRYEDISLRDRCQALGMKIIPKSFAELTPVRIIKPTEIVFIDDEKIITEFWQESAEAAGKTISVFTNPYDFTSMAHFYAKNTLIYLDSTLGDLRGEDFAKILFDQGFANIILATGYCKENFKNIFWVKDIIGKEPPWG